jgi:hypothetical protein
VRFRLFGYCQESPNLLRKILSRLLVDSQTSTHLRRLIFGNECHVFCRQFDRARFTRFDLPENQTKGKNYGDSASDKSFSCGIQITFLSYD